MTPRTPGPRRRRRGGRPGGPTPTGDGVVAPGRGRGVAGAVGLLVLAVATAAGCGGGEAAVEGGGSAAGAEAPRDSALERMAEEAVPRVESAAGLAFERPPRLARSSRDRIRAYVREELDEQLPPERARGVARTYARLGLLPDTVELRPLMESLYLSQIVGYYAPDADTLFVREGVAGDALEPVLVHELVHALQDQHMDLDSTLAARRSSNDAATAAQAALEGHATYVMLEDELRRRTDRDVDLGALDVAGLLQGVDLSSLGGAPELSGAPRLIRESLLFPYTGGLTFVHAFWRTAEGRPAPLGDDMPASTEQVLHPGRFRGADRDRPTGVGFPGRARGGWRVVHADGLGEFEVRLLLEAFLADTARARAGAAGWDGDGYRLLESPAGDEVLVWASVWDSPGDAAEFAGAASAALRARYARTDSAGPEPGRAGGGDGRRVRVERVEIDGRPAVLVTDAPRGRGGALPGWATAAALDPPSAR